MNTQLTDLIELYYVTLENISNPLRTVDLRYVMPSLPIMTPKYIKEGMMMWERGMRISSPNFFPQQSSQRRQLHRRDDPLRLDNQIIYNHGQGR